MSKPKINASGIEFEIGDILKEYNQIIYVGTERGLDEAQKILLRKLRASSPKGKTGVYKKSWRAKKRKWPLKRYVGNTKKVPGKFGAEIPLVNILEYAEKSPHKGLVKKTFESSVNEMANAVIKKIEEVK